MMMKKKRKGERMEGGREQQRKSCLSHLQQNKLEFFSSADFYDVFLMMCAL
jgi:hypothetical protein